MEGIKPHKAHPESKEIPTESREETYLQTDKGSIRGELLVRRGTERVVRPLWTHDGKGVGALMKFDATTMKRDEPMRFSLSIDGGKTWLPEQASGKLERAGRWEKGVLITLDELYARTEQRPQSHTLPDNRTTENDAQKYRDALPEYEYVKEGMAVAASNPEAAKCNFAFGNPNEGWKIHLNAIPENVAAISDYLKKNEYAHKYLSGGAGHEGKAFTVYFGAKSMMDKWAMQISQELNPLLCKPLVADEVEVASGVVGRFTALDSNAASSNEFLQYGEYGMSARRAFVQEKGGWKNITTVEAKRELAKDAYEHLGQKYGSYFHG